MRFATSQGRCLSSPPFKGLAFQAQWQTGSASRALPTEADQIAAMARSIRAKFMSRRIGAPITAGEAADIVELIELLADSVAASTLRLSTRRRSAP